LRQGLVWKNQNSMLVHGIFDSLQLGRRQWLAQVDASSDSSKGVKWLKF
jgi:hypothetical protein